MGAPTPRPFLVTGCGRSGTTWAAHLFRHLGHECLHEQQYHLSAHGPLIRSESSWLAVPYLHELPEHTPVLRIMRDPYAVVQSTMTRGFLYDLTRPFDRYAAEHLPVIAAEPSHLGRVIRWVTEWDEPVNGYPVLYADRGHGESELLPSAVQYATDTAHTAHRIRAALDSLGTRINTNPPGLVRANRQVTRSEIDAHPLGWLVRARAKINGYPAP